MESPRPIASYNYETYSPHHTRVIWMHLKTTDSYNIGQVHTFLVYVVCASVIYTTNSDVAKYNIIKQFILSL